MPSSSIADAIAGRRDGLFLVSKVLPSNASRRGTVTACERSLKRLKTDRLDCYLLHWRGSYPLQDTIAAFEELIAAGKIRSWGVSNFDTDDLNELLAVSGKGRIACNQVLYHLQERAIEHGVIPVVRAARRAVVAYSPFGHDDFLRRAARAARCCRRLPTPTRRRRGRSRSASSTRVPSVFPIPKASYADHAAENAAAGNLRLSERDRRSRQGLSARTEAARPADAVSGTQFLTKCFCAAAVARSAYPHPAFGPCCSAPIGVF